MSCLADAKQLAIVAEKSNPATNLSAAELTQIFLTKTRAWPDGTPVTVVVRETSSVDMQLVIRRVFHMTAVEARTFVEAHHGEVVVADSDEAMIRLVSTTRGAIGVIDLYSLTKDVKVIKVDGKLPVEQGYLLRGE
jgi:ABC-type phosphate transport system substrate-binding protein